eukprot:2166997-Rhodomonas_salina.2
MSGTFQGVPLAEEKSSPPACSTPTFAGYTLSGWLPAWLASCIRVSVSLSLCFSVSLCVCFCLSVYLEVVTRGAWGSSRRQFPGRGGGAAGGSGRAAGDPRVEPPSTPSSASPTSRSCPLQMPLLAGAHVCVGTDAHVCAVADACVCAVAA